VKYVIYGSKSWPSGSLHRTVLQEIAYILKESADFTFRVEDSEDAGSRISKKTVIFALKVHNFREEGSTVG
jgi:hypothetical protein